MDVVVSGSGGLNCKQRRLILDAHNQARQQVALGMVPGQPEAAAMLEMVENKPNFKQIYI